MAQLKETDFTTIRTFIGLAFDRMAEVGLTVSVEPDMRDWVRVIQDAPGRGSVSPTFDPRHSLVDERNSFWVHVQRGSTSVACIASRLFETDDYIQLLRNWRMWFDRKPNLIRREVTIVLPPETPLFCGRVSHNGGLWVHPDVRKRGLATLLPRVIRALSMQHFETDWHTGLVKKSLSDQGMPFTQYGYTHSVPCLSGYYPAYDADYEIYLTYISRADALARLAADCLDFPRLYGDNERVDRASAAAGHG